MNFSFKEFIHVETKNLIFINYEDENAMQHD